MAASSRGGRGNSRTRGNEGASGASTGGGEMEDEEAGETE